MTDQNQTPASPTDLPPGSPERAAAMAELYNARNNPPGTALPEGVPAKFVDPSTGQVNVALLVQSYAALEKRLGQPAASADQKADQPVGEAAPAEAPKLAIPEGADPASAVVTQAGLDPQKLAEKVATAGKLDDTDYAAIEKLGIPRALIDQHVELLHAQMKSAQASNDAKAAEVFGGAEAMRQALDWAARTKPPEEVARLNAKLASADWMDTVQLLAAQFKSAAREPSLARPGASGASGVAGYRSVAERTADMQNPRYRTDPSFRAQVRARMAVSAYDLDR